jgi:hypothetical protein
MAGGSVAFQAEGDGLGPRRMSGMLELERRLFAAIEALPDGLRPWLLDILTRPREERASVIGRLWKEGTHTALAELLIDLEEAGATVRALVVSELRRFQPS